MPTRLHRTHALSLLLIASSIVSGCSNGSRDPNGEHPAGHGGGGASGASGEGGAAGYGTSGMVAPPPSPGDYVSADGYAGERRAGDGASAGAGGAGGASNSGGSGAAGMGAGAPNNPDPREVVEGDIYRVLDAGTLLNLNSYRGLQVIDVSDPEAPAITGNVSILGTPVEMYVRGNTAFVLLNNWQGYYGSRDDVAVEHKQGGLVAVVDISDRGAPRELDRVFVEGSISTSRVVQNDAVAALYIASTHTVQPDNPNDNWVTKTIVTSFDISGEQIVKKSELDLGGYVMDIQATATELLVAGQDWNNSSGTSRNTVAVIDISDPNGAMVQGDTVLAAGQVQSQFNMDLYNGVLRVVSTAWDTSSNQVETFDASDLSEITPLHSCSFGAGQQLYATLFLENKAFFVTYLRQDPFHAFEIADDGSCAERNEFIVSGWNDFFRPVASATRLIGIGIDDADSTRTPAVSLYDITDLYNPSPLLARAQAGSIESSWSEAQSDHRAFSVIEGAVQVTAPDGTPETGLVLLPYQGYRTVNNVNEYDAGVALFTFSDRTVTPRGLLGHDSPVRRTFTTDPDTIANLSENSLALYDHSDPTMPVKLSTLPLAPSYARIFRYGDHIARVTESFWAGYGAQSNTTLLDTVEILPAAEDLNHAEPLASFEVPHGARLLKSGELLVSIDQVFAEDSDPSSATPKYTTKVKVFDLSDPTEPRAAGSAATDELVPTYFGYGRYGGYYGGYAGYGFIGCGMGGAWFDGTQADGVFALADKVVFVDARGESAALGTRMTCEYYTTLNGCDGYNCQDQLEGYATCSRLNGNAEVCTNNMLRCDRVDGALVGCQPAELAEIKAELSPSCWTEQVDRNWSRYAFKALDVSDPDAPAFGPLTPMPRTEEGVSVLPDGDALYYTYKIPVSVEDDGRPHVSYYYKRISFDDEQAPRVAERVSIPGELIAVDGARLYTKDLLWSERTADTHMHELSVAAGRATIESSRSFEDRNVRKVVVEGDRLYVVHANASQSYYWGSSYTAPLDKLALLDGRGLTLNAEVEVDSYSTLEAVHEQRALFQVSGGLLMINAQDAAKPYAQAFFHSNGWPQQILFDAQEVVISAGQFGIHRFDATSSNLLSEE